MENIKRKSFSWNEGITKAVILYCVKRKEEGKVKKDKKQQQNALRDFGLRTA